MYLYVCCHLIVTLINIMTSICIMLMITLQLIRTKSQNILFTISRDDISTIDPWLKHHSEIFDEIIILDHKSGLLQRNIYSKYTKVKYLVIKEFAQSKHASYFLNEIVHDSFTFIDVDEFIVLYNGTINKSTTDIVNYMNKINNKVTCFMTDIVSQFTPGLNHKLIDINGIIIGDYNDNVMINGGSSWKSLNKLLLKNITGTIFPDYHSLVGHECIMTELSLVHYTKKPLLSKLRNNFDVVLKGHSGELHENVCDKIKYLIDLKNFFYPVRDLLMVYLVFNYLYNSLRKLLRIKVEIFIEYFMNYDLYQISRDVANTCRNKSLKWYDEEFLMYVNMKEMREVYGETSSFGLIKFV